MGTIRRLIATIYQAFGRIHLSGGLSRRFSKPHASYKMLSLAIRELVRAKSRPQATPELKPNQDCKRLFKLAKRTDAPALWFDLEDRLMYASQCSAILTCLAMAVEDLVVTLHSLT